MEKTEAAFVIVIKVDAVAPNAVAVMVTSPSVLPFATVEKTPLELVFPVAETKVTVPPPDCVSVTGTFGTTLLPASFTVTVSVVFPVVEIDEALAESVIVEPTINTGICAGGAPLAVAVTVTVRFSLLEPL